MPWFRRAALLSLLNLGCAVVGPDRARWLYPLRSLADSGAVLVGGSDWSVSSMNPLRAIEVALTRREPGRPPGPAWLPDQTVDLPTMLAAYTSAGAHANRREHLVGPLEVGKRADLAILERGLFDVARWSETQRPRDANKPRLPA